MTLTVLIDYDSGNLHSAQKAFERVASETNSGDVVVSSEADVVRKADRIVLPGDGAFPACRAALGAVPGMTEAINDAVVEKGRPFFGICVGMQMLATIGEEYQQTSGFDFVPGRVKAVEPRDTHLKIPHMGWNDLILTSSHPMLDGLKTGDHAYFVHSWAMEVDVPEQRLAYVDYAGDVTAIVGRDNVFGTQFHPEKSQETGLKLIANFFKWRP